MKKSQAGKFSRPILILFLCLFLKSFMGHVAAEPHAKLYNEILRVGVVGDTGVGERAYHPGFIAVAKALKNKNLDLLLHLGDFVYQPEIFPQDCPERYIREIGETLADPFQFKLYVPGDNALPPNEKKPKGSGCWKEID